MVHFYLDFKLLHNSKNFLGQLTNIKMSKNNRHILIRLITTPKEDPMHVSGIRKMRPLGEGGEQCLL